MTHWERDQLFWGFQRRRKFLHCPGNSAVLPNGKLGFCFRLRGRNAHPSACFFANICKKRRKGRRAGGQGSRQARNVVWMKSWRRGRGRWGPSLWALISSQFTLSMIFRLSVYFLSTSFSIRLDGNAYCWKENKTLFSLIVSEEGFFSPTSLHELFNAIA